MFQQTENKKDNKIIGDQAQFSSEKNIEVHSMIKDLQDLKNPPKAEKKELEKKLQLPIKDAGQEKQKASPFLTGKTEPVPPVPSKAANPFWSGKAEPVTPPPLKTPVPPELPKKIAAPAPLIKRNDSSIGKIITFLAMSLIILILAGGSYYFLVIRKDSAPQQVDLAPPDSINDIGTPPVENPVEPASKFSADSPNYLQLDPALDKAGIRTLIDKYANDVKAAKLTGPIEFVVTDSMNNPMDFSIFAEKAGLTLSEPLMAALQKDFGLFVYGDQANYRLGLELGLKDGYDVKKLLLKEEPTLSAEFEPIFLAEKYTIDKNKIFSSSTYNTAAIRYINIISPEDLSLDYSVIDKKLFIGTTKLTIRTIIDYSAKAQPSALETPTTSPVSDIQTEATNGNNNTAAPARPVTIPKGAAKVPLK